MSRLSPTELARYQQDGFLVRRGAFSPSELVALRASASSACQRVRKLASGGRTYHLDGKRFVDINHWTVQFEHEAGSELVRVIEPVHEVEPAFDALVDDPRLVLPMRSILGRRDLALWTAKLNLKPAGKGSGFGWHQDSPYWVHDSAHVDDLPNVMVTFDDASLENGCLQVIRDSHRQGCLPGTSDGSQLGGFFTDPGCFDIDDAVAMAVPAGSLIFFSPHSIHGSGPNHSESDRRAVILTYQPAGFPALKSGIERPVQLDHMASA